VSVLDVGDVADADVVGTGEGGSYSTQEL